MLIQTLGTDPRFFFAVIITVVISICIHELAHGFVAIWCGDDTPIEEDRITFNPLVHMGPFSLIALVISGMAWGSMPINPGRLRGRYAPALVSAAGPASNFVLAVLSLVGLGLWVRFDPTRFDDLSHMAQNGRYLLWIFGMWNVALGLFNLIPVPPLDGSGILANLSSGYAHLMERMAHTGMAFMLFFVAFMASGAIIWPAAERVTYRLLWGTSGLPDVIWYVREVVVR